MSFFPTSLDFSVYTKYYTLSFCGTYSFRVLKVQAEVSEIFVYDKRELIDISDEIAFEITR